MVLTNPELDRALAGLAPARATGIRAALTNPAFNGRLENISLETAAQLLPLAAAFSVHPISDFAVGAIAVGASGSLYLGANLEFCGMPLHATLHAEQSAVLNAWMHNEPEVVALYVSETPCGHCRQFLRELSNTDTLQICVGAQVHTMEELLPHAFGEARALERGLLDSRVMALKTAAPELDDSLQRAIAVAQRSYVPYSRSPEGFVIECADGHFFSGRAAECAAFNPSVPGVLVALNQRNLSGSRAVPITAATEAKLATAVNDPLAFASALISSVSDVEITVVQLGRL